MSKKTRDSFWTINYVKISGASLSFSIATDTIYFIFPLYLASLGFRISEIGFIAGSYTFCNLLMRLLSGNLIDCVGGKSMATAGTSLFFFGMIGYLLHPIAPIVIVLRLVQGIGMSLTGVCLATLMTDLLPQKYFREGMTTYGFFAGIGSLLGSVGGLFLWERTSPNFIFLVTSVVVLLTIILIRVTPAFKDVDPEKSKEDSIEIMLPSSEKPWMRFIESTALPSGVISLLYAIPMGGLMTFLFPYAASLGIHGLTEIFLLQAGFMLFTRLQAIRWAHRWGQNRVLTSGFLLTVAAFLLLIFAKDKAFFLLASAGYGVGAGIAMPILNVLAVEKAPIHRRGKANSTYQAANDLGSGLGAFFLGLLADWFGFPIAFIASIGVLGVAVLLLKRGFLDSGPLH